MLRKMLVAPPAPAADEAAAAALRADDAADTADAVEARVEACCHRSVPGALTWSMQGGVHINMNSRHKFRAATAMVPCLVSSQSRDTRGAQGVLYARLADYVCS